MGFSRKGEKKVGLARSPRRRLRAGGRRRPSLGVAAFLASDGPYVLVGLGMSKSLQIFLARRSSISECEGLTIFCSWLDCPTMNDCHLHESDNNHAVGDIEEISVSSHGHKFFCVIILCCISSIRSVKLQGLGKNLAQ